MILPMYSEVLLGYVLTILHLKLVSQRDRPHVLMHTPIRTFLCWLMNSEMVSLFGRVSQFSKTSTIFVAQIAPELNHPVPVSSCEVASWSWTAMEIGPPFEANAKRWAQLEIFGESTKAFVDCEMLEKACSEYQIPPWWCFFYVFFLIPRKGRIIRLYQKFFCPNIRFCECRV